MLVASSLACGATLLAGLLVDHPPFGKLGLSYTLTFGMAGLAGFASSLCLARTPEPTMPARSETIGSRQLVREPLGDRNFRRVLVLLGGWNVASNIAAPFLTVYLIQQIG